MTLVLMLGLLLWARLKLVTAAPRMVYADPRASAMVDPPDAVDTSKGENAHADDMKQGR